MKVFEAIESGEACEQYVATIAALAGGTATSADVLEIRPHLRHCAACRATVRALHVPASTRVKLLLPGFLLAPVASLSGGVELPEHIAERRDDIEIIPAPGTPAAAAAADGPATAAAADGPATAAAADGPAAHAIDLAGHLQLPLDLPERTRGVGLARIKEHAYGLLPRTQPSDVAAGAYIASTTGGGRIATIATIIGFCVSGAGAGALCIATGVVKTPSWILDGSDRAPAPKPTAKAKPKPRVSKPRGPAELTASSRATEVVATPTPAPTPKPRPAVSRRPASKRPAAAHDPAQGTKPTSHENAPISEPPTGTTAEFGPESGGSTTSAPPPPTSAPATGGGEFLP
jgi:hypothetical protein